MKKISLSLLLFLCVFCSNFAQSLLKDSSIEPEGIFGNKISFYLRNELKYKEVTTNCQNTIFYAKFQLSEKAEMKNISISANMTDEKIISIIQKVLKETENIWDIEKCKKFNPTLLFLLPINVIISKSGCEVKFTDKDILRYRYDFASMLKYEPIDQGDVKCLFCPTKEKFIGMVFNPIIVNNGSMP